MTEGARRQCRLALTRKNTETNDELQLALFSSNDWSEESRQVTWAIIEPSPCTHVQGALHRDPRRSFPPAWPGRLVASRQYSCCLPARRPFLDACSR